MLSNTPGSIPMVFLVTDGTVEDERKICEWMDKRMKIGGSLCPRIHTFGIGKKFRVVGSPIFSASSIVLICL